MENVLFIGRAIDRNPRIRFNDVIERNGMETKKKFTQSNIEQLRKRPAEQFRYKTYLGLDVLPDYP